MNQTEFRLVHKSIIEKCNYNQNLVGLNKIQKTFLFMWKRIAEVCLIASRFA